MRKSDPVVALSNQNTLQQVARTANLIYWEAHSLLHAATLIAEKIPDDEGVVELQMLIKIASEKVGELQDCFNPYVR